MNPLFSVVVPIYNISSFLPQCLQSIKEQSYENFEVILVDDGSTDESSRICDDFAEKDSRFKVVHKENRGLVRARQEGVKKTVGEYIACVDGDDWIDEKYLETFARAIKDTHPDVVCCGHVRVLEKKEYPVSINYRKGFYSEEDIRKEIFPSLIQAEDATYFPPSLWAKVFKRSLYQQQQLVNCILNVGEDSACTLPCIFHASTMIVLEDCLYFYRLNENSITRMRKPFPWDGPRIMYEHLFKQIVSYNRNFKDQLNKKIFHELFLVIESQFNATRPYKDIVEIIRSNIACKIYSDVIQNAQFRKGIKGRMALFAIKHNFFLLVYIFNRLKRVINLRKIKCVR